jgi:hypothetical protein
MWDFHGFLIKKNTLYSTVKLYGAFNTIGLSDRLKGVRVMEEDGPAHCDDGIICLPAAIITRESMC